MDVLEKARRFLNKKHDTETDEMVRDLVYEIKALNKKISELTEWHDPNINPEDMPEPKNGPDSMMRTIVVYNAHESDYQTCDPGTYNKCRGFLGFGRWKYFRRGDE